MRYLLILCVVTAIGCGAIRSPLARKSVAVGVSLSCEGADAVTSAYAFGARTATEQNPLLAPVQYQPLRFALRKAALAAPGNVVPVWLWDHNHSKLARVLLYGNAVAKCVVAIRNNRFR